MNKKALIIDDSQSERKLLSHYLESMGFTVFEADNGLDGLEKSLEIKPDIIIMDIVMPGSYNGFQATRAICKKEILKNIPIILCSSKNEEKDKLWGKKQGAYDYIVKPVNEEILKGVICKIFNTNK